MKPFYLLLMVLWGALAFYTGYVITHHGLGLFAIFFHDIASWTWPGQFNFDFLLMLGLSASWTAWRNKFSASGFALALLAFFGGAGFLLPYLTYLAWKHEGDTRLVLVGMQERGALQ